MGELCPVHGEGGAEPEELITWLLVSKTREPYGPAGTMEMTVHRAVPAQVRGGGAPLEPGGIRQVSGRPEMLGSERADSPQMALLCPPMQRGASGVGSVG